MPSTTRSLRPRWHAPEKSGPSLALSILAHALLFASIAFVVRWKTEPAATISAELWGGLPPVVAVTPAPVEPVRPPPVEAPPAPPKADIVVSKAPEPVRKVDPPKEEKKPAPTIEKKPEPKVDLKAEALKREAAEKAAQAREAREANKQREAAVTRALAAAGGIPGTASKAGGEPGLARGFEAQVIGCIRPHIVFSVSEGMQPKQHVAEFEVQLLPTGEQLGAPRLLKASGLPAYDQAVERAIRRCDPFPRPREGAMPRVLRLAFDPVELR